MIKDDKISQRQLMVAIFVALFSPTIRILPQKAAQLGGRAAWLTPLAAAVPLLIIGAVVSTMLKNRGEGEGMAQVMERALGRIAGKITVCVFGVWLTIYAGFILRSAGERMLSTVYENGSMVFVIMVSAALALLAALGKIKSWARSGEVFLVILLIILIFTISFALTDIKIENLWPVTYMDAGNILLGAIPVVNTVSIFAYFTFLTSYVKKSPNEKRLSVKWTGYTLLGVFFIIVTTVGNLGERLTVHMDNPFFVMIRNITIFNIVERFEAMVVGAWIMTDFIFIAGLLMCASEAFKSALSAKRRQGFVWPCTAAMVTAAFLIAPNAFKFKMISDFVIPAINLGLIFIVLPIIFAVGKIRRTI